MKKYLNIVEFLCFFFVGVVVTVIVEVLAILL